MESEWNCLTALNRFQEPSHILRDWKLCLPVFSLRDWDITFLSLTSFPKERERSVNLSDSPTHIPLNGAGMESQEVSFPFLFPSSSWEWVLGRWNYLWLYRFHLQDTFIFLSPFLFLQTSWDFIVNVKTLTRWRSFPNPTTAVTNLEGIGFGTFLLLVSKRALPFHGCYTTWKWQQPGRTGRDPEGGQPQIVRVIVDLGVRNDLPVGYLQAVTLIFFSFSLPYPIPFP